MIIGNPSITLILYVRAVIAEKHSFRIPMSPSQAIRQAAMVRL